jgi:(1->4)-alpha-D-glucan 1-alpha-D-glucosylmutase
MTDLRATARLQFHSAFTLADAEKLVPYLARLGISHLYASPLLTARAGSTHGYDIVDPTRINPELGGEPALRALVAALRAHDMGLILDIVPNHMGVGGSDNPWWLDVLEWGRASPYAEFFDVDWDPPDAALRGRMLAPFLGSSYGDCLAGGELVLRFDETDGRFFVGYHDHRFPITPRDYPAILQQTGEPLDLAPLGVASLTGIAPSGITPGGRDAARRQAEAMRQALRDPALRPAIDAALAAHGRDDPAGSDRLHRLLERQHYRLAWWRAAADEINWRRFFDVNGLAGIRAEIPTVFDACHATVLRLYAEGLIDGVRIDHVDGLADPRAYCRKLRRKLETAATLRPPGVPSHPAVLWVEKILAPFEHLPADWLTDGTTGYDYMNEVAAVLHDAAGETPLTNLWTTQTGRPGAFLDEARPARRQILRDSLASELLATAVALHRIGQRDLSTRDWTLTSIHRALTEILVHFPSYRIYAGKGGISEADSRVMEWAIAGARRTVRAADQDLPDLRSLPAGPRRQERLRAMVRFQQLSAPTAAKSVEDTAFYRYGRLLSRNEVGTEPSQFAISDTAFHTAQAKRLRQAPAALLATATHDHKRGEDTRMRLAVLSELPDQWEAALARWTRLNGPLKRDLDGPAPDNADEIMLYQTLVGAWPLGLAVEDRAGMASFIERVAGWQQKSLREAKIHSGWAAPNQAYESACQEFLVQSLDPDRSSHVAQDIAAFAMKLAPAGALNSLGQTLLRLTTPGVPDLYQGTEFWDFSLVDPDNRRPVDYPARAAALAEAASPADLLPQWQDGRVKQAIIARALALRTASGNLFAGGEYLRLKAEGAHSGHILAFARVHEERAAVTIVTRLAAGLAGVGSLPLVDSDAWADTCVVLPRRLLGRRLVDVLGGAEETRGTSRLFMRVILQRLPVALLEVR